MSQAIITINEVLRDSIFTIMLKRSLTVSIAESCTGGFLSTFFTSGSGSSNLFKGSMITYSNQSKIHCLDISPDLINKNGVVSKVTVEEMAKSIRKKHATNYGLATTGYVELSNLDLIEKHHLHAWISISSAKGIVSKRLTFNKNRLENISYISYILLNLFRKEIL
tara:strand:+ start:50 stop:547 length:498 start_codon:yes stop_codon:yes gene_type:complete